MKAWPLFLSLVLLAPAVASAKVPPSHLRILTPYGQSLLADGKRQLIYGHQEQALADFLEAARQTPDNPTLNAWLARARAAVSAMYVQRGLGFLARKQFGEAKNAFDSALQVSPGDPEALRYKRMAGDWPHAALYLAEARKKLAAGQTDYAIFYYRKAYALVNDPAILRWIKALQAHDVHR